MTVRIVLLKRVYMTLSAVSLVYTSKTVLSLFMHAQFTPPTPTRRHSTILSRQSRRVN